MVSCLVYGLLDINLDIRCQREYEAPKAVFADGNEIPLLGLGTWG